ncbi:glucuronate isomerase [Haloferula rosea]|uniref:Uronate isomerase n=1 Tax=Haloferula rosea TaxID=490093 RepID=A0A934RCC3_9BACT|nr:glucuronate isomerase [Haloferula rosea]MBK1825855.1 glucuronate isomerase [Haloferula rosea]
MPYPDRDFLLYSPTAKRLFHEVADGLPIYDYHCHLPADEIANDQRWSNLSEIWLGGDHYKWRLMRANGVDERFITGSASPEEKFQAWAATIPRALRNPIHHWTHLELQRFFGIDLLLSPETADEIWQRANERLLDEDFSARGLMKKCNVRMVGTTDDPVDSLEHHEAITNSDLGIAVRPTFRPDKVFTVDNPAVFNEWVDRLEAVTDHDITQLGDLLTAIHKRHDDFHEAGARLSDHGLDACPAVRCDDADAAIIFENARSGQAASPEDKEKFCFYLLLFLGRLDASRGWTKQLHLGPFRNTNPNGFEKIGPDSGFDTIGDFQQGPGLVNYLGALAAENALPKMVLYNINPADNYLFAAMSGAFQDGSVAGKIQFGSGWWFMDQKEGMEMQLNALSSTGLLSRFVGMLTDSRSFLSFPRHEYFRRILCNLIGSEADRGELPEDFDALADLVRHVSSENAERHFNQD